MTKKIDRWATVRDQIAVGIYPKVFVASDGRLALDGKGCTLPADVAALFPTEIRQAAADRAAQIAASRAADNASRAADNEQASIEHKAICDRFRNVRGWRLAGLYVDDVSMARYTLAEIEAWLGWDAANLRHKNPDVFAVLARSQRDGGDYWIDLKWHFFDACNDSRGRPSFEKLCERLAAHVRECVGRRSSQN